MIKHKFTSQSTCPACGHTFDTATTETPGCKQPKPGDFALCCNCGSANLFDDQLHMRRMTKEEIAVLPHALHRSLVQAQINALTVPYAKRKSKGN